MQWTDGTTYFARAVSYEFKMFMKSTTGSTVIKLFSFVADAASK
jgi:hypothetical protein